MEKAAVSRESATARVERHADFFAAGASDCFELAADAHLYHRADRMQAHAARFSLHGEFRQKLIVHELYGIEQPELIETLLVLRRKRRSRRLEAVGAWAGIDHDGQLALLAPAPHALNSRVHSHGVRLAEALRGKRCAAARTLSIVGNA